MTDKIRAPWTPEQVAALNRFQREGGMHPFTCGHEHPAHPNAILEATTNGWRCYVLDCEYTQDWAHAFMADPEAWPRFPFGERHGPTPEEMKAATEATGPDAPGYCPHCGRGDCAPTADDYEQQRQRADRAEAELRRNTEAEAADAAACSYAGRAEQAEAALARVHTLAARLEEFAENALKEPDRKLYAALARDLRSHAAIDPPAHNAGPSIAECAADDRNWDLEKTGE